jgi:hypothetical protein
VQGNEVVMNRAATWTIAKVGKDRRPVRSREAFRVQDQQFKRILIGVERHIS